jgi:hypothetical protein
VENRLDDAFTNFGLQVVKLRGVVPRKTRAVVPVIDVAGVAAPAVHATKHDGGIGLVVVVVFYLDLNAAIVGEIGPVEAIRRIRTVP